MSMSSIKAQQLNLRLAIAMLCASAAAIHSSVSLADTAAAADTAADTISLDEVIVTGSRQAGLKAADSPAPIQILSAEALKNASGNPDLMSTLAQIVPSLTMQAFGADMAGQTLLAKLRGLSPNHVLILVNGKRRHTTANLAVDGGSTYQGGAGVDLNFIPVDAIDHIEVLTEGAAAQYGTDAIAGVINIILKKNSSGGNLNGTYGNYMNGGGNTGDVSGNAGLEPTDGAYFNVTGEVHNHGHSNQSAIDERVINPANLATYPGSNMPSIPGYPYLNEIQGDAETHTKLAVVNTGIDFEGGTEIYGFATYGDKSAASYENYRPPNVASYTDPAGVKTYPLPFGFEPQEASKETDYSLTAGLKGQIDMWNWDLSSTYGGDRLDVYTLNSYNTGTYAATGEPSVTDFYDGLLQATQWTSNADFNRDFDVGLAGPLNVAFGAEYRRETYTVGAGNPASYEAGGAASYPGFTPQDAGTHDRKNEAVYVDFAAKPVDGLRVDAAGRFEHYSDFGNAKVGKLTARYDFAPEFAIRGTVSNGFRAPTLAEEYYSSTNVGPITAFVQLPPNSPGGKLLGLGNGLQPEKSVNLSLGFVWRPTPGMTATLDLYQIQVTNRIVGSGNLYGSIFGVTQSPAVNSAIAANGSVLSAPVVQNGLTGIDVFANGIDTRTQGADLVFDFPVDYAFGHIDWSIGATFNQTDITKVPGTPTQLAGQTLYDATALSDLTTANPKYVANLGAVWTYSKATVSLVEKIYGPAAQWDNDDADNPTGSPEYFKSSIGVTPITNLDLAYQFTEHLKVDVGALNLFDHFPPKLNSTLLAHENNFAYGDNAGVGSLPGFSPFGINGGFWYVKATYTF
jgi:iron complex outermembrane recepter protein